LTTNQSARALHFARLRLFAQYVLIYTLFKLSANVIFSEPPGFGPQHIRDFSLAHTDLATNWNKTASQIHIVLLQELDRHHEIVDIIEHKRPSDPICLLRLQEMKWMVSPVPPWIQVM
jgi:hypothetical protein